MILQHGGAEGWQHNSLSSSFTGMHHTAYGQKVLSQWVSGLVSFRRRLPGLVVYKQQQHSNVVSDLQTSSEEEADPEEVFTRQHASDQRTHTLAERFDDIDYPHRHRALFREDDGRDERRPGGCVHALGAGSKDDQCHRDVWLTWDADECHADRGRQMGEHHGAHVANAAREWCCEKDRDCRYDGRGEEEGADGAG